MTRYCKVLPLLLLWCGSSCQKVPSVSATQPIASLLQMESIPRTPERLARGKYLVEGVLQCFSCHSELDFTQRPFQLKPGTKGGGAEYFPRCRLWRGKVEGHRLRAGAAPGDWS